MAKDLSKFIRKGSSWTIERLLNKAVISNLIAKYNQVTGVRASMSPTNVYRGICFLAKCVNLTEAVEFIDGIDPKKAKGFKEDLGQFKGGTSAIVGGVTALLSQIYDENTKETVGKHFLGIDFNFGERKEPAPKKEEPKKDKEKEKTKPLSFVELSKEFTLTNDQRLEIILNKKLKNAVYNSNGQKIDRYQSVYLQGEAGCGKTQSVFAYADKYNLEAVVIPRCEFPEDLLGSPNLDGSYKVTILAEALKGEKKMFTNPVTGRTYQTKGCVVLFDECDTFGPAALVAVNNLISQGIVVINNQPVTIPENFRIVCAGNTTGFGATETYGTRSPIDGSFMDRLAYLTYDYEKDIENKIVDEFSDRLENPRIIAEFYRDLRRAKVLNDTNWILSYRGIENFCLNLIEFKSIKEALLSCVVKGLCEDPDALNQIVNKMTKKENPIFKVFQRTVKDLVGGR